MAPQRPGLERLQAELDQEVIRQRKARRTGLAQPQPAYLEYFPDVGAYITVWACLAAVGVVSLLFDLFWPLMTVGALVITWGVWGLIGWCIRRAKNINA